MIEYFKGLLKDYYKCWDTYKKPINAKDYGFTQIVSGAVAFVACMFIMLPWWSLEAKSDHTQYYVYIGHLNVIAFLAISNILPQVSLHLRLLQNNKAFRKWFGDD
jgi:heme A synthase